MFDEFDALACQRGSDTAALNRVVAQLLSQMDGFESHSGRLTIIAATNRPWDLDSAIVRPPRITHKIYVPLPDEQARAYMIKHTLSKLPTMGDIDYDYLVRATEGFSGADIQNFINQATRPAIRRGIDTKNVEQYITYQDLLYSLKHSGSSICAEDKEEMMAYIKGRRK